MALCVINNRDTDDMAMINIALYPQGYPGRPAHTPGGYRTYPWGYLKWTILILSPVTT